MIKYCNHIIAAGWMRILLLNQEGNLWECKELEGYCSGGDRWYWWLLPLLEPCPSLYPRATAKNAMDWCGVISEVGMFSKCSCVLSLHKKMHCNYFTIFFFFLFLLRILHCSLPFSCSRTIFITDVSSLNDLFCFTALFLGAKLCPTIVPGC